MPSIFDQDLPRTEANSAALSPLSFIERARRGLSAAGGGGAWRLAPQLGGSIRCRAPPASFTRAGIGRDDTVAVMLPNTPRWSRRISDPMAGAVLNALNAPGCNDACGCMLDHGEAKAVIVDPEFAGVMKKAIALRKERRAQAVTRDRRARSRLAPARWRKNGSTGL